MKPFERLFNPRGIAIVGASGDLTRMAGQTVRALNQFGFAGGVYPVNPKYGEIDGRKCHRAVTEIEGPCDVAVVALPAEQVPGVIAQCGQHGIRYAVVLSGGFREVGGRGLELEAQMLAAAREHDVRVIGPNCIGVVNVYERMFAAFASMTRPPELKRGAVSAILQSGGFGMTMVIRCALAGIGFRYLVASGGESDVSTHEMINAYVDDPATRVILAYVEGIKDGRAFMAAAQRARAAGKPIVLWKGGRARQGALAAASHTANLTGSYDIMQTAFRQCGIVEVRAIDEAVDFIQCFLTTRLPRGRNAAIMTNTGGCAVAFCDTADDVGISLATLAPQTTAELKISLPALSSLANPIDYTAGRPRPDDAPAFLRAFSAVLADPNVDQLGMLFGTVVGAPFELGARLLAEAAATSDKPVMVFSAVPREVSAAGWDVLEKAGIPVLPTPMRMAKVMSMLAAFAEALRHPGEVAADKLATMPLPDLPAGPVMLDEHESKQLLAGAGITATRDCVLAADFDQVPAGIPYPVAVKILSRDIPHKSDIGGVLLNVMNAEELRRAAGKVMAAASISHPELRLNAVLVSGMVSGGVEMMVGVVNDPAFGPVVVLGMGGVLAEVLHDVTYRIAPFGLEAARQMTRELRASAMLDGVRGQPPADRTALAETLVKVSRLAWQLKDRVAEMDINPLLVRHGGEGTVALDALVVLR